MQKPTQIRQLAGHSTSSQNELLSDQQDICLVAEHQDLNLDQRIKGLPATGVQCLNHEQNVSS